MSKIGLFDRSIFAGAIGYGAAFIPGSAAVADRPFSGHEQAAIEQHNNQLAGDVSDAVQTLNDLDSVCSELDLPTPPDPGRYSPIKLTDDTSSN